MGIEYDGRDALRVMAWDATMNFFKKNKGSKTPSIDPQDAGQNNSAEPDETISQTDGNRSEREEARRIEFLAMLAEEEKRHRERTQTSNNVAPSDTSQDVFIDDPTVADTETKPIYTPRPIGTSSIENATQATSVNRAAALGIGGDAFLTSSKPDYTANFAAELSPKTPSVDVTPKSDKATVFIDTVDPSIDMGQPLTRRMNMGDLRLDVARITSDIDNGEALYRRAQQRVSSLLTFVERAEVDFSLLDRLEPENRRLKARNRTLSSEVETQSHKINVLQADLDEHRRRLAEAKAQYDTANGSLARSMKAVADRDREIKRLNEELNSIALKMERLRTSGEVETRENAVLRDRIAQMSEALETIKTERATLTKMAESLKIDCDDHRQSRDRLQSETHDLRHALDSAQKQNNQMKGEMVALHEEITTFKTQYEFNIISRDDRIYALESQLEDLTKQLEIKDDIVASATKDVSELRRQRTAQELERERLEKMIEGQSLQLDDAQTQLLRSKENMQELDQRYRDVAAALSVNQSRRTVVEPASAPDIHPEMDFTPTPKTDAKPAAEPKAAPQSRSKADPVQAAAIDDLDNQTEQSIEDRIMDYKLGLRKNIF